MLSRHTGVTVSCVFLATASFVLAQDPRLSLTDIRRISLVITVGVSAPLAINSALDARTAGDSAPAKSVSGRCCGAQSVAASIGSLSSSM